MSVVAVPVDDPDAAVELPVAPAVPALETDELDCGEVAGLVEAGAALVVHGAPPNMLNRGCHRPEGDFLEATRTPGHHL